jgi:hypothetical protein
MYPLFVRKGPIGPSKWVNRKRHLMFCICAMIALIFVSSALCSAPSCPCLYCILLSAAFATRSCVSYLRAGFLPTFMRLLLWLLRVHVPPLHGLSFVHLCVCRLCVDFRLHSGTSYPFIRYPCRSPWPSVYSFLLEYFGSCFQTIA